MSITTTPLYKCESCGHTSADPYYFRIIEGRVKVGNQTLCVGYDFNPEVLCIECFCTAFGIGQGKDDTFCNDNRFRHIHPAYTEHDKDQDKVIPNEDDDES